MPKNQKIIDEFLSRKNVAAWFRGISHYQILGADMLFSALRDDAEQGTTHRIRTCLNLIGLEPMITSKQITFLMKLSRCNDLIFLWFLMEMHYKTPKPGPYCVNEQLICSSICHLDMITTLRQLDKILPSGHTSRIKLKSGAVRNDFKEHASKRTKTNCYSQYVSPYFEMLARPQHYGKQLTLEMPPFRVKLNMYKAYGDPNYNVQNETNRWFANYEFNAGKRIAYGIIRDIIENIFNNLDAASLRYRSADIECDYHKSLKLIEINLEHEKRVQERNECLKKFIKSNDEQQKRIENIRKLLAVAVKKELCKLGKDAKHTKTPNGMSLKTITSNLKIFDVILGEEFGVSSNSNSKKEICKPESEIIQRNTPSQKVQKELIEQHSVITSNNTDDNYNINNYDFDHISDTSSNTEPYFHRPSKNKPYKFDYSKIFMTTHKADDHDEQNNIQKMCLKALDETISDQMSNGHNKNGNKNSKYDEAVSKCANTIFDNEVKAYEESIADHLALQDEENLKPLNQYPNRAFYNANDHTLMDQMLYDAFQYLRKNPKYVWAQLPDAHKVPSLREWIARRFGKEFSSKQRVSSYRKSCKIFPALGMTLEELTVPNSNLIGKNHYLNYDCRNYLDKKVKYIKNKYCSMFDSNFLEQSRIFWFTMRGYLCANGPPRKTFFAYMPSKYRDIQHFRLWKSTEFRNYKVYRHDRRRPSN